MNTPRDPSSDDAGSLPPSDEVRAAEYVAGVLGADERREVEARVARERAFARLVEDWEGRFSAWLAAVPAAEPSAHVWPRIRSRLGWESVQTVRPTLWNNTALWRGLAGLATAAGIAAVTVLVMRVPPPAQPPVAEEQAARPVTVLARDNGATGWIARIDPALGKVLMVPVPTAADASGRVHELWIIPAGGAPQSLGFLSNEKAHTIDVPPTLRTLVAAGATLAVTLEDQAGIPHRAPNGPVVASGNIQSI
jgi:anti-sigma-K factor RskA